MGNTQTKQELDTEAVAYAKSRHEALDHRLRVELEASEAAFAKAKAETTAFKVDAEQRWAEAQRVYKKMLATAAVDAAKRSPEVRDSETRVTQAQHALGEAKAYRAETFARYWEMKTRASEAFARVVDAVARKHEAEARCYESHWRPVEELEKEEALAREKMAKDRNVGAQALAEVTRAYDEAIKARDDAIRADKQSGGDATKRIAAAEARAENSKKLEEDRAASSSTRPDAAKRMAEAKARAGDGAKVDARWQQAIKEFAAYEAEALARRKTTLARVEELQKLDDEALDRYQAAEDRHDELKKAHATLVETVVNLETVHRQYETAKKKYAAEREEIDDRSRGDSKKHEHDVDMANKLHQVALDEAAEAERAINAVIAKEKERHTRELATVKDEYEAKLAKAVAEVKRLEGALQATREGKQGGFLANFFS